MPLKTLIAAHEASRDPVKYIVKGVIPETGVGIMYAPSTEGKTLIAIKLAMALTNKVPFFGHDTIQSDVLIALGEGREDFGIRCDALSAGTRKTVPRENCRGGCPLYQCHCTEVKMQTDEGIFLYQRRFGLVRENERRNFINQVKTLGHGIRLIIFDTLSQYAGVGLGWPANCTMVMNGLKEVSEELNCFVLVIHHTNKDEETMQGSQVLFNDSNVVIKIKDHVITNEKQKAGMLFDPMPYEIITLTYTDRKTGDEVFTAYVKEEADDAAPSRKPEKPRKIPQMTPRYQTRFDPERIPERLLRAV